jgi:2-oxoglutarate dehydrogenase E1 component
MTPKSLLRNPRAASHPAELEERRFLRVLDDPYTANNEKEVKRLILCTGKVAIDLSAALETGAFATNRMAIVRVEQLYPFPQDDLLQVLKRYPRLREVV